MGSGWNWCIYIANTSWSLIHLHGFQLLLLLWLCIIYFFCLYQQNKSSELNVKSRQASNHCKSVLEAAKLAYANKAKESIPRNLALLTFGELVIVLSTKVNLLYLLYSAAWRCCLLHVIKQICFVSVLYRIVFICHLS